MATTNSRSGINGKSKNQNRKSGGQRGRTSDKPMRGKKPEREPKDSSAEKAIVRADSLNDLSWYSHYPDLLLSAASVPYPYKPGMAYEVGDLFTQYNGATVTTKIRQNIPGVMALNFVPAVGRAETNQDPVNIAAKEVYAKVRSKFSGALDADAPDFMIYIMAMDSIYSYIGWLKRVYKALNAYTPENFQLPDAVLKTMGFSDTRIVEMRRDKMKLLNVINTLIYQTHNFMVPDVMDIIRRHYWMNENVYLDANSLNSQIYLFNQTHFYKFATDSKGAGMLASTGADFVRSTSGNMVDKLYDFGNDLIKALAASDDGYTISGYLMRAFEGVPSFTVATLAGNEIIEPVYSMEVLSQIENARVVNAVDLDITQVPETNTLLFQPLVQADDRFDFEPAKMVNLHVPNPTPEMTVVATRLMAWGDVNAMNSNQMAPVYCGTEIVTGLYFAADGPGVGAGSGSMASIVTLDISGDGTKANVDKARLVSLLTDIARLEQFDWHPLTYLIVSHGTSTTGKYNVFPLFDTATIGVVSESNLIALNRVCVFSEFNAFSIV